MSRLVEHVVLLEAAKAALARANATADVITDVSVYRLDRRDIEVWATLSETSVVWWARVGPASATGDTPEEALANIAPHAVAP